jgi:hypothetical protein
MYVPAMPTPTRSWKNPPATAPCASQAKPTEPAAATTLETR